MFFNRLECELTSNRRWPFLVLGMLLIMGGVGNEDYKEEIEQQRIYCEMVRDGKWPDYKKNYFEICFFGESEHGKATE